MAGSLPQSSCTQGNVEKLPNGSSTTTWRVSQTFWPESTCQKASGSPTPPNFAFRMTKGTVATTRSGTQSGRAPGVPSTTSASVGGRPSFSSTVTCARNA